MLFGRVATLFLKLNWRVFGLLNFLIADFTSQQAFEETKLKLSIEVLVEVVPDYVSWFANHIDHYASQYIQLFTIIV